MSFLGNNNINEFINNMNAYNKRSHSHKDYVKPTITTEVKPISTGEQKRPISQFKAENRSYDDLLKDLQRDIDKIDTDTMPKAYRIIAAMFLNNLSNQLKDEHSRKNRK